jgi:hypothetical protein
VKLGTVRGDLLTGATIAGISITDSAGRPFLKADSLSGRYTLGSLLRKRIAISDLVIYRPEIVIEKLPGEKDWNYRRLWPASKPTPGDTLPGFGSWIRFDNARVVEGHLTVRSPWSPRAGITARARDSLVNEALTGKSRLMVVQVPGGYVKVIELRQLTGRFPLVQLADPSTKIRSARRRVAGDAGPALPSTGGGDHGDAGPVPVHRRLDLVEGSARRSAEVEHARRRRLRDRQWRHAAHRHGAARGVQ